MITANEAAKRMIALGYLLRGEPVPDVIDILPPQATHYEPMHIPKWWHEEYLKSLEPKPPFDLDAFLLSRFDDIAVGFADFGNAVKTRLQFLLGGALFGGVFMFLIIGHWAALIVGVCIGGFAGIAGIHSDKHSQTQENQ